MLLLAHILDKLKHGNGNGAVASSASGATLKNNLSLLESGYACTIFSNKSSISSDSNNNYQLTAVKNQGNGIETISKNDINANFFKTTLGLSTDIWDIPDDASIDKLPTLKGVMLSYSDKGNSPEIQIYTYQIMIDCLR